MAAKYPSDVGSSSTQDETDGNKAGGISTITTATELPESNEEKAKDNEKTDSSVMAFLDLKQGGKKLSTDVWQKMRELEPIQGCLFVYKEGEVKAAVQQIIMERGKLPADIKGEVIGKIINDMEDFGISASQGTNSAMEHPFDQGHEEEGPGTKFK